MIERKHGVVGTIVAVLGLVVVGGVNTKRSECRGDIVWKRSFKDVAICNTSDGKIQVQRSDLLPHKISEKVDFDEFSITPDGKEIRWRTGYGPIVENWSMDLETGKIKSERHIRGAF